MIPAYFGKVRDLGVDETVPNLSAYLERSCDHRQSRIMKKDSSLHSYTRQIGVGLAASGGLLCAACISGLPAVTCKALATLYGHAIVTFGTAAFCGVFVVSVTLMPNRETDRQHHFDTFFVIPMIAVGMLSVLGGMLEGIGLGSTIEQCWH